METSFTYYRRASGKAFIGRKAEKEAIKTAIRQGIDIVIYERSKIGKSSLVKQSLSELFIEGSKFTAIEINLLSVRSIDTFLNTLTESVISAVTLTPQERKDIIEAYIPDKSPESILALPEKIASKTGIHVILLFFEFQNIIKVPGWESLLRKIENNNSTLCCSRIWMGSGVNGMKFIFEKHKFLYRKVQHIKLNTISYKEALSFITKGFLSNGKVIEETAVELVYKLFQGDIYYLTHFAAICDSLSRGFITDAVVDESIRAIISIHEPEFTALVYDLTDFQINFIEAILQGETKFSSAAVIEKYNLSSSANVKRLKEALCKKEIITFDDNDKAVILDPLFEFWLRNHYFNFTAK